MQKVVTGKYKQDRQVPLDVFVCQDTNEIYCSSIRPLVVDLCPVESCLKMWFKDTW